LIDYNKGDEDEEEEAE